MRTHKLLFAKPQRRGVKNEMSRNVMVIIAVVLVAVIGIGVFMMSQSGNTTPESTQTPANEDSMMGEDSTVNEGDSTMEEDQNTMGEETSAVKEFTVTGRPFEFDPAEMTVKVGDTVRITFVNEQGTHDWVLDEFNARTEILQSGQSETIEFVADQAGEFEYYCSVGNHREMGMVGTLTVEE